jgi:hypothetical protein
MRIHILNISFEIDGIIKNADPTGKNTYCNWTWDGCVKPTDIVHCKTTDVWGTVSLYNIAP